MAKILKILIDDDDEAARVLSEQLTLHEEFEAARGERRLRR